MGGYSTAPATMEGDRRRWLSYFLFSAFWPAWA